MKYALEQPSWNGDIVFIGEDKIYKASFNIIDLIEVGDYVNDYRVVERMGDWLDLESATAENKDIKSIVTKEQFESMEYKLGDSNE